MCRLSSKNWKSDRVLSMPEHLSRELNGYADLSNSMLSRVLLQLQYKFSCSMDSQEGVCHSPCTDELLEEASDFSEIALTLAGLDASSSSSFAGA